MTNWIKKSIIIAVLFFGVFSGTAFAQVKSGDITLEINPTYPAPNQNVKATLNSYSIDLNKANITWSINGKELISEIGKKIFSFTVDSVGSSSILTAKISTIEGQEILKTITIAPTEVDMLWEATDSYTPPFYRGKALVPNEGSFKVVAIPNLITSIGRSNTNNLAYLWTQDGKSQQNSSGWGKNYFIFKNSYLDTGNNIEVEVSDITGNSNTSGSITLQTVKPEIVFYKKDLLLGTQWEKALNNGYTLNKSGDVFIIEPYFFSPKNISSPDLTFDWSFNGESIQTPDPKNILSIKPESGKAGSAKIKIAIDNTQTLFQSLEKEIEINF